MEHEVVVLRYGHRPYRDERVTTHCCLVARALGAGKIIIEGKPDKGLKKTVGGVAKSWGGAFKLEFTPSWRAAVKKAKKQGYKIVHLTMYGKPLEKEIAGVRKAKKIMVIIGSQKVEIGVYRESDFNIAIGKQPHSEIAALAVFLDRFFRGKELGKKFSGAKITLTEEDEKK